MLPHQTFVVVSQETIFSHARNLVHRLTFGYFVFLSFREKEENLKDEFENNDISDNNNIMKKNAIMASSAKEIEQPNNEDNKVSNEEFDKFKSISMDSEGKEKMAELEDKARLLEAQFEVENRITMERIKNIREELKVSQGKEATTSQECEEIKTRADDLSKDLSRLEKKIMEEEILEREERKKIGKEKRKVERKLKKLKAKKSAALATIGREEIEDEKKDGVSL